MAENKNIRKLIERMEDPDIFQCAVVMLTKNGKLTIDSYNIDNEIDVLSFLKQTTDQMVDEDIIPSRTLH